MNFSRGGSAFRSTFSHSKNCKTFKPLQIKVQLSLKKLSLLKTRSVLATTFSIKTCKWKELSKFNDIEKFSLESFISCN